MRFAGHQASEGDKNMNELGRCIHSLQKCCENPDFKSSYISGIASTKETLDSFMDEENILLSSSQTSFFSFQELTRVLGKVEQELTTKQKRINEGFEHIQNLMDNFILLWDDLMLCSPLKRTSYKYCLEHIHSLVRCLEPKKENVSLVQTKKNPKITKLQEMINDLTQKVDLPFPNLQVNPILIDDCNAKLLAEIVQLKVKLKEAEHDKLSFTVSEHILQRLEKYYQNQISYYEESHDENLPTFNYNFEPANRETIKHRVRSRKHLPLLI